MIKQLLQHIINGIKLVEKVVFDWPISVQQFLTSLFNTETREWFWIHLVLACQHLPLPAQHATIQWRWGKFFCFVFFLRHLRWFLWLNIIKRSCWYLVFLRILILFRQICHVCKSAIQLKLRLIFRIMAGCIRFVTFRKDNFYIGNMFTCNCWKMNIIPSIQS